MPLPHVDAHKPSALAPDVRLIAAHPDWNQSRVNRRLFESARDLPRVDALDLYARYPDYAIDVACEQQALAGRRLLVLMHPVHWYGMPALLKLWLDEVLTWGWAYGEGGTALQGIDCWLVASTGGTHQSYSAEGYNHFEFSAFLPPYAQTANLCGMRFLPPLLLHGAHRVADEEVEDHAQRFVQRLRSYPDWPDIADCRLARAGHVPAADRLSAAAASAAAAPGDGADPSS